MKPQLERKTTPGPPVYHVRYKAKLMTVEVRIMRSPQHTCMWVRKRTESNKIHDFMVQQKQNLLTTVFLHRIHILVVMLPRFYRTFWPSLVPRPFSGLGTRLILTNWSPLLKMYTPLLKMYIGNPKKSFTRGRDRNKGYSNSRYTLTLAVNVPGMCGFIVNSCVLCRVSVPLSLSRAPM